MATKNDITGDKIISKSNTQAYRDNYDKIFYKGKCNPHNFIDNSYWNGENHPTCSVCGFVDITRVL